MTQTTDGTAVVAAEQDFDKAFGEAAVAAEVSTQALDKKDETPAPVIEKKDETPAPETPEALAAKEATDKAEADAKAKADEEARIAALTPEARAEETAKAEVAAKVATEAAEAQARLTAKADADNKARQESEDKVAADKKAAEDKVRQDALDKDLAPYVPSDAEKKALETLKTEWPEQAAALEASLKAADQATKKKIHEAVSTAMSQVAPSLASVQEFVAQQAQVTHLAAIKTAHTDFDQVVVKIPDWIKTQPALLQPTLQRAYDAGDTQSVIDLFTTYKASVGTAKPATSGETAEQITAREKKEAEEKKARDEAAAMVPVNSKRTVVGPKGSKDPNDFDGAFGEAAELAMSQK